MQDDEIYIYGRNTILEALESPRKVLLRVFVSSSRNDPELRETLKAARIGVTGFDPGKEPRGVDPEVSHQGVIGVISGPRLMREYNDFMKGLNVGPQTCLVILGEVQDPQNVGAIIRSAAGFGASAVLIPEHNQAQLSGAVVKVSAGMAFQVPLIAIGNVNQTARDLKERGFWIYGLDRDAAKSIGDEVFDRPTAFILGNEGKGMREKTKEVCDILLKIPIHPRCESFNVSVSAGVALSHWSNGHPEALRPT